MELHFLKDMDTNSSCLASMMVCTWFQSSLFSFTSSYLSRARAQESEVIKVRIIIFKRLYKIQGLYKAQVLRTSFDFFIFLSQNLWFHTRKDGTTQCTSYLFLKIPQPYCTATVVLPFSSDGYHICSDEWSSVHTTICVFKEKCEGWGTRKRHSSY